MAGHLVASYLRDTVHFNVSDVGPRREFRAGSLLCDMSDRAAIVRLLESERPEVVVNCLGVLVSASEVMKLDAIWVNSYLPHFLYEHCQRLGTRLVHLSTDCVFSGNNGPYPENAHRDGDLFYDRSKALGELDGMGALTIRCSIIGPELSPDGSGLFNWLMMQHGHVRGYSRAMWSGVTTLELARFIGRVIIEFSTLSGLIHYSVPGGISKYDLLVAIGKKFSREINIEPVSEPVIDKRLLCTRDEFGEGPPPYEQQLQELKTWIDEHTDLYQHYRR